MNSAALVRLFGTSALGVAGVLWLLGSSTVVSAEVADASLKQTVAKLYKAWMQGRVFTCAYEVHEKRLHPAKSWPAEVQYEVRLTLDPSTQRYLYEMHVPPPAQAQAQAQGGGLNRHKYRFLRWNGEELICSSSPYLTQVLPGGIVVPPPETPRLADLKLGAFLDDRALVAKTADLLISSMAAFPMEALGFTLDGKPLERRLEEMLRDPAARLEHLEGKPADDLTLTLGFEQITFDLRLGLVKSVADLQDNSTRTLKRFPNGLPSEVRIINGLENGQPVIETNFKAIADQCRVMGPEEFNALIHAPLPGHVKVTPLPNRSARAKPSP